MDGLAIELATRAGELYTQLVSLLGLTSANVLVLAIAIAIYASIVGTFYLHLSKKVLYEVKTNKPKGFLRAYFDALIFILEYTILFPLISFLWFVILSILLYLLSQKMSLDTIFMLSISIVAAIRICAYYSEHVAVDLAKLLPLTLLAVLLADASTLTQVTIQTKILELLTSLPRFVPYLGIAIAVEWILRLALGVKHFLFPASRKV
ncbi:MAG: hypothetical protein V1722_00950 [Candidatus Micrarchaeota archaeon]